MYDFRVVGPAYSTRLGQDTACLLSAYITMPQVMLCTVWFNHLTEYFELTWDYFRSCAELAYYVRTRNVAVANRSRMSDSVSVLVTWSEHISSVRHFPDVATCLAYMAVCVALNSPSSVLCRTLSVAKICQVCPIHFGDGATLNSWHLKTRLQIEKPKQMR